MCWYENIGHVFIRVRKRWLYFRAGKKNVGSMIIHSKKQWSAVLSAGFASPQDRIRQ
jgi:hypothetical protein